MKALYKENTANYPRLKTDTFFVDCDNTYKYEGTVHELARFVEDFHLKDINTWKRFADQFKEDSNPDAGWRGEFWGKMMRGASFLYAYTKNPELYSVLHESVEYMMSIQEEDGRLSCYGRNHEFDGWDIWERKYVLLGMQYFMEICLDEDFNKKIISSMCRQVDYIMSKIGAEPEKTQITVATRHWRGLNSSSLLEPIVRLYTITGEQKYFDFAKYIVDCGGMDVENVFQLAFEDKLYPYQYPVTKAYEMTSCFEGLLEFYRVTGEEWYKQAVINFANKVLESDFTIIGSSGCTHELYDHSAVRQANTNNGNAMQETCVTVTLMKFFYQLLCITGDARYADAIEISFYNAYLGAINTEKVIEPTIAQRSDWHIIPLPFDSYSPLVAGKRGTSIGGFKLMKGNYYFGCCACIGAAGMGIAPKIMLMTCENGYALNMFIPGNISAKTPAGKNIRFIIDTKYPKKGNIKITLDMQEQEKFEILVRNPAWSKDTKVKLCGENILATEGYIKLERIWNSGDVIELELDMNTYAVYPQSYGSQVIMNKVVWGKNYMVPTFDTEDPMAKNHISLRRGPITLAQENRLGYSVDTPVNIKVEADGTVDVVLPEKDIAPYNHMVEVKVPLKDGSFMTVTDYASAGKLWTDESKMAAWMLTE